MSSNGARDRGADAELIADQRLDVTAPAQHAQDQDVVTVNAVRNHVVSDHETADAWPQIFVPATADVRLTREKRETSGERVDHAVSDVDVAALGCEEVPDLVQVGFSLPVRRGSPSVRRRVFSRQSLASALFDVLGKGLHGVFRDRSTLAARERCFCFVE